MAQQVSRCIPCSTHSDDIFIVLYAILPGSVDDDQAAAILAYQARTEKDITIHKGPVLDLKGHVEWAVSLDDPS